MKRILIIGLILISVITPNITSALGLQFRVVTNGNTRELEYIATDKKLSFKEAKNKYNVNDYFNVLVDGEELFFYQGEEISLEEYTLGVDNQSADERTLLYEDYGIRVHNTKDIISNIDNLYTKRIGGEYHFIYSKNEYESIDFDKIDKYIIDHYFINKNNNIFSYEEYGIFYYPRFLYNHDEYEMIVDIHPIISIDEEDKMNDFMDTFKNEFNNKTDYEKILVAFTYLSKTISKPEDDSSNVSAYNALIDRKAGCIGTANAFGYIMSNIGIEAYIASNSVAREDSVVSTHTFNIVKLNNQYYIVDLSLDGYNGFLITNENNVTFSNGIIISNEPYVKDNLSVSIDYDKYDKLVDKISREVQQKESLDNKKKELNSGDITSYLVLVIILLVLTIIIILFTRK